MKLPSKEKLDSFKRWLIERGAQILEPTNQWEVVRFVTDKGTTIIYSNKQGKLTFTGHSQEAWIAFVKGIGWRATQADPRKRISPYMKAVRKRDGDCCFYCLKCVSLDEHSLEHLLSKTHGGSDTIYNLVLAHAKCNQEAGNISVMEKVKIREANLLLKLEKEKHANSQLEV